MEVYTLLNYGVLEILGASRRMLTRGSGRAITPSLPPSLPPSLCVSVRADRLDSLEDEFVEVRRLPSMCS